MNICMNNTQVNFSQQNGASLITTLILMVVITLIGISAMLAANNQVKLAGNLQFQNLALDRAEIARVQAEWWLSRPGNANSLGFEAHSSDTKELYPTNYFSEQKTDPISMNWNDSNSKQVGSGSNRYLIEQLGEDMKLPGSEVDSPKQSKRPCSSVDLFRTISRGQSQRGAVQYVQTVYSVLTCG